MAKLPKDQSTGPLVWIGIIVTTCVILLICQTLLWLVLPILFAVILQYISRPMIQAAMRWRLSRKQAVLFASSVHVLAVTLFLVLVIPPLLDGSVDWHRFAAHYLQAAAGILERFQVDLSRIVPIAVSTPTHVSEETLEDSIHSWAHLNSSDLALQILHWIPSILLIPYFSYFLLLDGGRFKTFLVRAIPNAFFERSLELFFDVDEQVRRYLQGLIALTALDAACLGVGLLILGFPFPFALGIIAAVFAWVPYLGSIAGCAIVVIVAAADLKDLSIPYEAIILFIVVRLLDDFVFLPLTVGRSLRMHPVLTVVMFLIGGAVAGISGLFLVMPVFAVVMVVGRIIGELLSDDRIKARHRHALILKRRRAQIDLLADET